MKQRNQDDRRKGAPDSPLFGELLLDAQWEPPQAHPSPEVDGWLRARGAVPERRQRDRRTVKP